MQQQIRNVAIIAHVDHGKTTLVDALLKQSENFSQKAGAATELIMDSNELERERGITIFSKNAAVSYKGTKINIVDTPGHADFGGEVERIMQMVDGVLLLVDAKEGPMPQTKFVLGKALQAGHRVIVVVNKIDKDGARTDFALNKTFDLFIELGATDEQADFPVVYAAGALGKAGAEPNLESMKDIEPVFDLIVKEVPPPTGSPEDPLAMLVVNLAHDTFKGKLAIGKIMGGIVRRNQQVLLVKREGGEAKATVSAVTVFDGLGRGDVEVGYAGDIVALAGLGAVSIGDGVTEPERPQRFAELAIEEPTVAVVFGVNSSPFAGKEGKFVTSRHIYDRLLKEVETDVALRVEQTATPDAWTVSGRGELHLTILIEKMRREGFEFQVGQPQVITKVIDGTKMEPVERLTVEVPEDKLGGVIEEMGKRRGTVMDLKVEGTSAFVEFTVPTRGLIGFRSRFTTLTKGQGIMHSLFEGYEPLAGDMNANAHGSLVAHESGTTRSYGLMAAEERGELFVGPGIAVYEGMVVGENAKDQDLRVNVCKEKKLSNMRAKSDGGMEFLKVPRQMTLEDAIEYIGPDELVEVTPESVRIRKRYLTEIEENRAKRDAAKE
jgi:GTP-binding protein